MRLANETVATTVRVLDKCSAGLESMGPWRWTCVIQNGARLPLTASLEEGFLHLVWQADAHRTTTLAPERALLGNHTLAGGVKFALNSSSRGLHLRAEIVHVDEPQMLDRVHRALAGFHHGYQRLKCLKSPDDGMVTPVADAPVVPLSELLRETAWSCTERGPNDFYAALAADSAPPARITATRHRIVFSVDLVHCDPGAEVARQALAVYLLTASSALRLARAYAVEEEGQPRFGFEVSIPVPPTAEEIDHALAALSIAYRMCAREVNVLLDEPAARFYLTVRGIPITHNPEKEKEI